MGQPGVRGVSLWGFHHDDPLQPLHKVALGLVLGSKLAKPCGEFRGLSRAFREFLDRADEHGGLVVGVVVRASDHGGLRLINVHRVLRVRGCACLGQLHPELGSAARALSLR